MSRSQYHHEPARTHWQLTNADPNRYWPVACGADRGRFLLARSTKIERVDCARCKRVARAHGKLPLPSRAEDGATLALVPATDAPEPRTRARRAPRYTSESLTTTFTRRGPQIKGSADAALLLQDIATADREHFVVFDLDVRHRVIQRRIVHVGSLTGVDCHPREVFKVAVVASAAAILVAHNHPSGETTPSRPDVELTQRLREAGDILGITVLDHVIVAAGGSYHSFAERGWI